MQFISDRLERLRLEVPDQKWTAVAKKLGCSVSLLMQVRSGKRKTTPKLISKLRAAEVDLGLATAEEAEEQRLALFADTPARKRGAFLSEASQWNMAEMTQKLPMLPHEKQDEITGAAVGATNRALSEHFAKEAERYPGHEPRAMVVREPVSSNAAGAAEDISGDLEKVAEHGLAQSRLRPQAAGPPAGKGAPSPGASGETKAPPRGSQGKGKK